MGRKLADSLAARSDARVTAVADPVEQARHQAAEAYSAESCAEWEQLLARPDIDAVIVATPSYLHSRITIAAAKSRKHIFCEKPMALHVADCDAMIRAAADAGVKLMVGQVLRLMFPFWKIKQLSHELGAPFCASIRRIYPWSPEGWRAHFDQSGGPLFEVHVHELDFMRHLCGDVAQVSAYGGRFASEGVDYYDVYLVNLRFRSGAVGHLHGGVTTGESLFEGKVLCQSGALSFGPEWGAGAIQRGRDEVSPLEPNGRQGPVGIDWEIESFVHWLRDDEPPVVTAQDGRAAVQLAEIAYRSIAEGRPIDVPSSKEISHE
jgi:myo-inositol 2-dehydrogenase/D-chiro-inositol 1-dehydrogenase/scyllo-inositol 2-dehydrogenase (NAD+)